MTKIATAEVVVPIAALDAGTAWAGASMPVPLPFAPELGAEPLRLGAPKCDDPGATILGPMAGSSRPANARI